MTDELLGTSPTPSAFDTASTLATDKVALFIKEKKDKKATELTASGKTIKDGIGITYNDIQKRVIQWGRMANALRFLHILVAFTSVAASLIVASKILGNSFSTDVAAFLAALSAGILASFNLSDKSNNSRDAWRKLNEAKLRYDVQDDFTMEDLISAYAEGEKLIGNVTANVTPTEKNG